MNEYELRAGRYSAIILDRGAILYSFKIDDRDIILEYDEKTEHERSKEYFSEVVGPFANRIKNASYILDGVEYKAEKNDGNNSLHSGSRNYGYQVWSLVNRTDRKVTLSLYSPEGFGFPGNHSVEVIYSLKDDGELTIHYSAISDKACPFNITNHAFFNLNSTGSFES